MTPESSIDNNPVSSGTGLGAQLPGMLCDGDSLQLTVTGDCMEPVLRHGQQVRVEKCHGCLPGDIIVFASHNGEILVHRFLGWVPGRDGRRAMTRADNEVHIDVLVPRARIVGKVVDDQGLYTSSGWRLRAVAGYLRSFCSLALQRLLRRN